LRKTIVCLANSYKHGGRCVAGIGTDGAWIRLCGSSPDGALQPPEYALDDGSEPRLLDLIEVELHRALPSASHPEDWQIAPARWRLVERPASATHLQTITAGTTATIFGDHRDRIAASELKRNPLKSSLTLVCPSEIHWWIREEHGKRKNRALFKRNDIAYDFPVTDPRWLDQLNLLPADIYPHATFAPASAETWLTVSLSEPYFGFHYKLVAGVILRDRPAQKASSL
jgi:hypothetical protein